MTPDGPEKPADPMHWLPADGGTQAARLVRPGLVVLSLVVLAIAVGVALQSLLRIAEIWFEYQYVPIARAVLGLAVAAGAVLVLRMLLRKAPAA
jgi:hypothetical protein